MLFDCCFKNNVQYNKIKITMPDSWTGVANGQTELKLESNNKEFGLIVYIESTGEIRRLWVSSNYDQTYFYKILIKEAISDIKKIGGNICWMSSSKSSDLLRAYGNKFIYSNPINKKINCEGYYLYL